MTQKIKPTTPKLTARNSGNPSTRNLGRAVLAANVMRMIDNECLSVRGWAMAKGLDVRMIDRMTKAATSVTLDKIEEVAAACGLEPWELLLPGLQPGQRMDAPITEADRQLLSRLKHLLK